MDGPITRTRDHHGLRIDEQLSAEPGDRVVAVLQASLGEAHEAPRDHGVGSLLLVMAREAARRPGVDLEIGVGLDRSVVRFDGRADAVGAAIGAALAEIAAPSSARFERARAELRGATGPLGAGPLARFARFGATGFGVSAVPLHAVHSAGLDVVHDWAAHWHTGTVHLAVVGQLPDIAQPLPTDGPVPQVPNSAPVRQLPGVARWSFPHVGLSWLLSPVDDDHTAAIILADRLRDRLVGGPVEVVESFLELIEPGTEHAVIALRPVPGREAEAAASGLAVLEELATAGPTEIELVEVVDRHRRREGAASVPGEPDGTDAPDLSHTQLSPDAVRLAAARIRSDLLLLRNVAEPVGALPVATVLDPPRSNAPTPRKRAWSALWTYDRRSRIELLADGARLVTPQERTLVTTSHTVVLERHADGTRGVLSREGRILTVDPVRWLRGRRVVEHLDEVFASVAVDAPAFIPPTVRMREIANSARWLVVVFCAVLLVLLGAGVTFALLVYESGPGAVLGALAVVAVVTFMVTICVLFVRDRFVMRRAVRLRDELARRAAAGIPPGEDG